MRCRAHQPPCAGRAWAKPPCGKLTSTKWANIEKCSQDTASRDIDDLIQRAVLVKDAAGGRSTSYSLARVS
jgi:Fic family protein